MLKKTCCYKLHFLVSHNDFLPFPRHFWDAAIILIKVSSEGVEEPGKVE